MGRKKKHKNKGDVVVSGLCVEDEEVYLRGTTRKGRYSTSRLLYQLPVNPSKNLLLLWRFIVKFHSGIIHAFPPG